MDMTIFYWILGLTILNAMMLIYVLIFLAGNIKQANDVYNNNIQIIDDKIGDIAFRLNNIEETVADILMDVNGLKPDDEYDYLARDRLGD